MPRIARGLMDNCIYHVINRGNAGQKVFRKEEDYEAFVQLMEEAKERCGVSILAYCIMPNHFHMALVPGQKEELSLWMQWLMTSHVRRYHRHYGSSGHIWQGRYKSFPVQEDRYLLTLLRYIEGNPVRAAMVESAMAWKWSSHRENTGSMERLLTSAPPIGLPPDWTRYVDTPLTARDLEKLRESVRRQAPYGQPEWQAEMCATLGLESTMRRRGRPHKEAEAGWKK